MNYSELFHPINLLLAVSITIAMISVQQRQRRRMMKFKFCADSLYGIYLTSLGGLAGGLASFIAATGAFVQTITPDDRLDDTIKLRVGIAVVLSILAVLVSVEKVNDLLPILAVIYCRFVELQKDAQKVRVCFVLSAFPWMSYNYINEFYWLALYNIVLVISLIIAIIRHRNPVTPLESV